MRDGDCRHGVELGWVICADVLGFGDSEDDGDCACAGVGDRNNVKS